MWKADETAKLRAKEVLAFCIPTNHVCEFNLFHTSCYVVP